MVRGMVRCMESNHNCTVTRRHEGDYACACPLRQNAWVAGKHCGNRRMNGPPLEQKVWTAISDFLAAPETVLEAVNEKQQREAGTEGSLEAVRKGVAANRREAD